jgi:hypothetical protein
MYLLVPMKLQLSKLDQYFRDVWLECCHHLSQFKINGITHQYQTPNMKKTIGQTITIGSQIEYVYDFGNNTTLSIDAITICKTDNKTIKLISRNDKPYIKCKEPKCKHDSIDFCTNCQNTYCNQCINKSKHHCITILPIVNSPRFGICCYK